VAGSVAAAAWRGYAVLCYAVSDAGIKLLRALLLSLLVAGTCLAAAYIMLSAAAAPTLPPSLSLVRPSTPDRTLLPHRRALREYEARVAAEGAYSDEELPEELIDSLEREAGEDRKCFAVGGCRAARLLNGWGAAWQGMMLI
jgi:hypothetical protein